MAPKPPRPGRWAVGLYRGASLDTLKPMTPEPIVRGSHFPEVKGIAVADPFAIRRKDAWYLFFELFQKGDSKAVIGASRSVDLRNWEPLGVVMEQPHHLSYPFVFEHDGEVYMMPESKSTKRVDIFRAIDFPRKWGFEKTILRGRYMDCSMLKHDGRYWLFAGWSSYWLRLFHAPHPLGPWRPHCMPVIRKYSKASTRPGGRPLQIDGKIVRFSQDNVQCYGHQLRAWQVTSMNRIWYADRPLFQQPILQGSGSGWNARCMHHIDAFEVDSLHPCTLKNQSTVNSELIAFVDGCA